MHMEPTEAVRLPGKLTICALTYGEHPDLCHRMLSSIYKNTDSEHFELRLGLNAAGESSRQMVSKFAHGNLRCYDSRINLFKSPMMRRLFHEPPVATTWTAWFDDDSYVLRADWLQRLGIKMQAHPEIDAWGVRYLLFPDQHAIDFVRTASWYRGLPWITRMNERGIPSPCFEFPTGGFWVVRTQILQELDWPDRRLHQAGDDFFFGEALRQNGFQVGSFNRCIAVSAAERRNASAREVAEIPAVQEMALL